MKVVGNSTIPFPGFRAINIFGIVFVRKENWDTISDWSRSRTLIHEGIHTAQMRELLFVGFYILYFLEWLWEVVVPPKGAYRWISFEQEAYAHEDDEEYLEDRKHFAQWRKGQ